MEKYPKNHISEIHKSFEQQASGFDSTTYHLSKSEYLEYMVKKTAPQKTDHILEVAAGTCICGRAFAPYVEHITCLDTTAAMLEVGKSECEKKGIHNITFVKGIAEELPFLDNSFDIVMSRLAFHHFVNPKEIFAEMKRVLKPGGKLVLMDMTIQKEDLRNVVDEIERLRDNSHVRDLSKTEMEDLYVRNGMKIIMQEQIEIPVILENWMELTHTPEKQQKKIHKMMLEEMDGNIVTGFSPYIKEDKIYFNHHWVFNLGKK